MTIRTDKSFYTKLIKLTLPMAFQSFMLASVAAADSFMLGRVDQSALAAVSLATQVQFVQNIFIAAVCSASVVLSAQYWGKGNKKALVDIFSMILRLSGIISLAFCLACELFPALLMRIFTSDPNLIGIGTGYLRLAGFSYLLTGISQCFLTMLKVTDRARLSAEISAAGVLLNIFLNAVLIFGLFGLPALGVAGAAAATLIARVTELLLCLAAGRRGALRPPTPRELMKRNGRLFRDYLPHLLPITGAFLLWGLGLTTYTAVIGHMGEDVTAANAIAAVIRELMCCLCNGVSNAGGIIVGNELGKGDTEKGRLYGGKVSLISVGIGVFSCAVIIALTPLALAATKLEPAAVECLKTMMIIMGVYMIARSINGVVINGVFSAGGDTRFDMYSLTVCMWCVSVPMAFLSAFVFRWPVAVVYAFTCFDEVVKLPWVFAHYKKYRWVRDLTRDDI